MAMATSRIALLFLTGLACTAPAQDAVRFHADHVLGTSCDLAVMASPTEAATFRDAALREVERLERILSGWREDSQVAALNRGEPVANAAPELMDLLEQAEAWQSTTRGAFDARLGGVATCWRDAAKAGREPDDKVLADRLAASRASRAHVDRAKKVVRPEGSLQLALDGIGKGFVLDRALAAARKAVPGAKGALLDIGGDEASFGKGPGGKPWRVGIADPRRPADNALPMLTIGLEDRCCATSGGYARGFDIRGVHHSHILDPGTGRPATAVLQATVAAPDAATADALATALCVLDPAEGLELANSLAGIDCIVVDAGGKRHLSRGFASLQPEEPSAATAAGGFPDNFELRVALELPRITSRYKRPYTAIWVEDTGGTHLCTLALWGRNRRWISELTGWWRAAGSAADDLDAVARASRGAGSYTVAWGGRDDAGKAMGPGEYVVVVEVSREHGGHTTVRQKVRCGTSAAEWQLAANKELASCTVSYGPGSGGR